MTIRKAWLKLQKETGIEHEQQVRALGHDVRVHPCPAALCCQTTQLMERLDQSRRVSPKIWWNDFDGLQMLTGTALHLQRRSISPTCFC